MPRTWALALAAAVLTATQTQAQVIPFSSSRWEISANESKIEQYLGRESLRLKGGVAVVKDSKFTDGIIEFDIAFSGARGFMGAFWRGLDAGNYEDFYMRPHQSGKPDANQYTPVFNGVSGWQLYHGDGFGKAIDYVYDQWMHVKIVVSGRNAEIYIMDMAKPVFFVNDLKRPVREGVVGLKAGNFAPAYFSRFSYSATAKPELSGRAKAAEKAPDGSIMSWLVSSAFAEKSLQGKMSLSAEDKQGLTWTELNSEPSGVANLARVQGLNDGKNTAFVKIDVESKGDRIQRLRFGYSDRIRVYLNDRLIYAGNNTYQSRDFRYLGTIGLFDEVFLPLKSGDNEIWLAVSESFGGWGIKATLEE